MKKIIAILLALVMVVGMLAACNNEKPVETNPNETQGNKPVETQPEETEPAVDKTQPLTLDIMVERHSNTTNDAKDLWFIKYLDWWLKEQGWTNVTINATQLSEADQLSLMLATDSLPDLIMGPTLSASNAVVYGSGEEMIMDWAPYMNETSMPNLMNRINENITNAITAPDGGIYSVPYITSDVSYKEPSSDFGMTDRLFIHQAWLDKTGKSMPTNIDELLDVLRAFKEVELESGEEVVPLSNNADFLQKWIWAGLGYYGSTGKFTVGTEFAIKDEQVYLPAYTDDYRYYVTLMNQLYTEGLISPDFYTMDGTAARGIMTAGRCGALCDWTIGKVPEGTQTEWHSVPVFALNGNDQVAITLSSQFSDGRIWANSSFECPELIVEIVDYLYSTEGFIMYRFGPMKGQEDPIGIIENGWYIDDNGTITNDLVVAGEYSAFEEYSRQVLRGSDYVGGYPTTAELWAYAGYSGTDKIIEYTDVITGETIVAHDFGNYNDETTFDGAWRATNSATSANKCTTITLPNPFFSEDEALIISELKLVIDEHIKVETAKFVTGQRSLDELDDFFAELESLEVEEYVEYHTNIWEGFMNATFG